MKKAIIIAKGKVQKVGYRDFVQDKIKYGDVPEELGDRLGAALIYQPYSFSILSIPSKMSSIEAANENLT